MDLESLGKKKKKKKKNGGGEAWSIVVKANSILFCFALVLRFTSKTNNNFNIS